MVVGLQRFQLGAGVGTRPSLGCRPPPRLPCSVHAAPSRDLQSPSRELQAPTRDVQSLASTSVASRPAPKDWQKAVEAVNEGEIAEVTVQAVNKGGVIVYYGDVKGFIPVSCLTTHRPQQVEELSSLIGTKLTAKFVSVDNEKKSVIMREENVRAASMLDDLQVGQFVTGVVKKITTYGAFVSLPEHNELSCLLHISEVSWTVNKTMGESLTVGQTLNLVVHEIDRERLRVNVSLKRMTPAPWLVKLDNLEWAAMSEGELPEDMGRVVSRLREDSEVASVSVTRGAEQRSIAAQELEAYLTKEDVPDGFLVVLRLGTVLAEVFVRTTLDRPAMKKLLGGVLRQAVRDG